MNQVPIHCNAVSAVVVRTNSESAEVLLLRRNHTLQGEWCQIAGTVEEGEQAWETALREIAEETGLECEQLYTADFVEHFYEADRNAISLLPVFVAFVDPKGEVVLNSEHSEYRWVSFDEAERMLPFRGQRKMLRHVWEEFVKREPNLWLLIRSRI